MPTMTRQYDNGSVPASMPSEFEEHMARTLIIDPQVQRELIPARIKTLSDSLDLDAIGVITVSHRDNGKLVILDGQHRVRALLDAGMGDWEVLCHIYRGLTLQAEARLFRLLNNTRRSGAYDDYTKGVLQGDYECVAIDAIVHGAGLRVHNQATDGSITCVAALRAVHRSAEKTDTPGVLADTLRVVTEAWGHNHQAVEGHLIKGIGMFIHRHHGQIDKAVLIRKLAKFNGGASGLLGKARGLKEINGESVAACVATLVQQTYNRGRQTKLDG